MIASKNHALRSVLSFAVFATCVTAAFPLDEVSPRVNEWNNRVVIGARNYQRSASLSGTFLYSTFEGRRLEGKDWMISANPSSNFSFWFSSQTYLAKGKSSTSRLNAKSDSYGFKWVFKPAKTIDDPSWAFQYEAVKTYNMNAITSGAAATYFPTKNNLFSVQYETPTGTAYALAYASVKAAGEGNSDVVSLGYGKDVYGNEKSGLRFQAFLVGQRTNLIAVKNRIDFRGAAQLLYRVQLTPWLAAEAEGSILPAGMAYAGGNTTGLSSFLIYDPGGAAEGLRKKFVGYGALRLVATFRF